MAKWKDSKIVNFVRFSNKRRLKQIYKTSLWNDMSGTICYMTSFMKCQKSREIEVLTLNEKISLSSEQLEELQWNFQERRELILKVTQKTRLHRLSRRYKFGTSYNYCKNLNWKKPSQDFQFFNFGYRTNFLSQFIFVFSEY